ncbi:hypothetical protein PVAND_001038 [Polypedilum vanderplanki]|uniref:Uncharacterized protein n=1 Tax=Polypedilum vanderplanki TaxID=319348 RepID=A0A9J6BM52_POLVA|nr:hypothetical protein PVAND_001038 [Polypedilum vanderplanki]
MKIIFKIVLIFLLLYEHVESSNNNFRVQLNSRNSISVALTNVIDEFFIKQEILFDVVFVVPYSKNYPDIFDLTLTKIKNHRPISIKKFYPENYVKNFLNSSSIIFIDWSVHKNLNLSKFFTVSKVDPRGLRFLLYYQNCSDVTAKNTTFNDDSSTFPITLYSFIICHQDENTLNLVTHEWFEPGKCNQRQIKILNSFDLETKTWKNPLKNYQKFKNFNGCYFEILDLHDDPLFNVFTVPLKNTSIISSIARKTNFTFDFVNRSYVTTEIFFQPGYLVLYDKYATTTSYSELKIGLIVTEGEAYSDYEKLLLPFDESTWTLLLGTFAFAFMLIFCLNRMRIQIREIFYGKGVTMPSFNVVDLF